ncbi:hypothetical protein KSD_90920 [Ktedonobacter sp. SOSP1-85]|nr:hypothetical protein [Ktedonobacter sp. SOSP1-85]GHO81321.1 hypothetical protein KSD_90920 [Ktedonobacter sp. SOSP1-85]
MAISHFVVTLVDRTMTWVYEKSDRWLGSRLVLVENTSLLSEGVLTY